MRNPQSFWDMDGEFDFWNGSMNWWNNDKQRHRLNGPAIIYTNDDRKWYIYGQEYTEEQYWIKIACMRANGEI